MRRIICSVHPSTAKSNVLGNTRNRISSIEDRISEIENALADPYIDDDLRWSLNEDLEILQQDLKEAWADDEAEWRYAVDQQEFNPDGSLKYYGVDACDSVTAATSISDAKSDCKWMEGLYWDIDGHTMTIANVQGYPTFTCDVVEKWIGEDTYEEHESAEKYLIKEDKFGHVYLENCEHPEYKLYLNSAFNYMSQVPEEFDELAFLREESGSDDEYDDYDDDEYYTPSATGGDYSPSSPWNAPGMSIHDFI